MRPILLVLALSACTPINHNLRSYVEAFAEEARARGVEVPTSVSIEFVRTIRWDGDRDEAAAVCTPAGVRVSATFWDDPYWSEATRRQVVFHELGHCLLGLDHEERKGSGEAASIMDPMLIGGPWYERHEAIYLDRLFATARPARASVEVQAVEVSQ